MFLIFFLLFFLPRSRRFFIFFSLHIFLLQSCCFFLSFLFSVFLYPWSFLLFFFFLFMLCLYLLLLPARVFPLSPHIFLSPNFSYYFLVLVLNYAPLALVFQFIFFLFTVLGNNLLLLSHVFLCSVSFTLRTETTR